MSKTTRFKAVVEKKQAPSLTIDANDKSFIPTLKEYIRQIGARIDIEAADRDKEMEQLDHLLARARHWQEDNQISKPSLDLKKKQPE